MEKLYLKEIKTLTLRSVVMDSVVLYKDLQLQQVKSQAAVSRVLAMEADTNLKRVRKQRDIAGAAAGTFLLILILL